MPEAIISASGTQHGLIVNPDGSINTAISGGIHIGSVSANVDSVYVQSGNVSLYDLDSTAYIIGSVAVSNFGVLGSGVVITAGSVQPYSQLGSVEIWQKTAADLVVSVDSPADIGSYTTQTIDATNLDIRDLASGTDVVGVFPSGTFEVDTNLTVGSEVWIPAGSVTVTLEDVGSPCFKQATAIASGTYTQVWQVGGAGSRLEVHGWEISTNLSGVVRVLRSGTTPAEIVNYHLNYASGAEIEKTFVTPIVPGGADIHMGFGTTSAGSTAVTIYGREIK